MFILMTLFLLIGIGLIGYSFLKWVTLSQFLFRDLVAAQKLLAVASIGVILLLIALFNLF